MRSGDKIAIVVACANGGEEVDHLQDPVAPLEPLRPPAGGARASGPVTVSRSCSSPRWPSTWPSSARCKTGAIAVPLFTLFGPDGIRLRVEDCKPKILVTNAEKASVSAGIDGVERAGGRRRLRRSTLGAIPTPSRSRPARKTTAIFQYTSGTTRELPAAVKHKQRALVTLMLAALYGTGIRPGDRFFCPSSPAWGHGLWHGTLAPLALGVTIGAYCRQVRCRRGCCKALQHGRFNTISAAATHFRMMRNSGASSKYSYYLQKVSFTGEPMDSETEDFVKATFGRPVCSMYGTTEIGVILVNYPGREDFQVKHGFARQADPGGAWMCRMPRAGPARRAWSAN